MGFVTVGVIYTVCTNVGRAIIKSHITNHPNISISAIVSLSADKGIEKSNYDNCLDLAIDNEIPHYFVSSINHPKIIKKFNLIKPTLIIQSGWSEKFSDKLLKIPKYGCLGEHPSPIPKGRGAATINWAIINGETKWADSFFIMNQNYDDGPVISQKEFHIKKKDNVKDVYDTVALRAYFSIKENLNSWFNGDFKFVDTKKNSPSYFKKRKPKDGQLLHSMTVSQQINFVRALTKPYPGAYFYLFKKKIIIMKAEKLLSSKVKGKMKKLEDRIFIWKNKLLFQGSCNNFLYPKIIESNDFPIINTKEWLKSFLNLKTL